MGAASTVMSHYDCVHRLRLNDSMVDDEVLLNFLKSCCEGKYLMINTSTDGDTGVTYTVSPEIGNDMSALFWFIRLKFRETRKTIADMLAFRYSLGEDVGLFNININQTRNSHAPPPIPSDAPYIIQGENSEISDLEYVMSLVSPNCIAVNLSSNSIADKDVEAVAAQFVVSNIRTLQLGGNHIKRLTNVVPILPAGLLVLDLSYCEGLITSFDCLKCCFQLIRLVLDNCGLSSTLVADTKSGKQQSLFQYLYCLQELSLRENNLDSIASLAGLSELSWTGVQPLAESLIFPAFGCHSISTCTLQSIWLAGNPFCDIPTIQRQVFVMLQTQLSSLMSIDDKAIRAGKLASNKLSAVLSSSNSFEDTSAESM